jgi:hypothetical protein
LNGARLGQPLLVVARPAALERRLSLYLRGGFSNITGNLGQGSGFRYDIPDRALSRRKRMPDDKSKRGGRDRKLISLTEDYEKNYWKKKFKVSGQALAGAVRAVGHSAKKVEEYLKRK